MGEGNHDAERRLGAASSLGAEQIKLPGFRVPEPKLPAAGHVPQPQSPGSPSQAAATQHHVPKTMEVGEGLYLVTASVLGVGGTLI